jgi:hypothetical protein
MSLPRKPHTLRKAALALGALLVWLAIPQSAWSAILEVNKDGQGWVYTNWNPAIFEIINQGQPDLPPSLIIKTVGYYEVRSSTQIGGPPANIGTITVVPTGWSSTDLLITVEIVQAQDVDTVDLINTGGPPAYPSNFTGANITGDLGNARVQGRGITGGVIYLVNGDAPGWKATSRVLSTAVRRASGRAGA